jgi:succinate dehydrogenase/fumarate reductase flavoprotein subunit
MMQKEIKETFETDVLVIGAGAAGLKAAIEAENEGVNVIIANKGVMGRDGAAVWMAGWGFQAALYPPDSVELHIKDTIVGGKYLNDQELVNAFLRLGPKQVEDFVKWGLPVVKKEGKILQARLPGHTYPRTLRPPKTTSLYGHAYRWILPHQVSLRPRIKVLEDFFALDLLKADNAVVGVVGWDMREGGFKLIKAKSTILATGGPMGCYKFTSANLNLTGDGHAMAYRAGAKMGNTEFLQFVPYVCIWPPVTYRDISPFALLATLPGGHFYNRLGERFMERYSPVEKEFSTRETVARAILAEVRAGRGSPAGGAYFTFRHLPKNVVERFLEDNKGDLFLVKLKEFGIDMTEDAIEIAPGAHYSQGGCEINTKCETSLPGLYAIGEVGGGEKDGADRLAGNAITFCFAMGEVSGKEAASRAKGMEMPKIDEAQVKEICAEAAAPVERKSGVAPKEVKAKIRELMSAHMIFARKEDEMEFTLKEFDKIKEEMLPQLYTRAKIKRFNKEIVEALEAKNMLIASEMMTRAALMRKETRGLHEREDYPNEDPEWLKHIIVENVKGQMTLSTKPVTFPYVKPA